jgi:hypothetical protein
MLSQDKNRKLGAAPAPKPMLVAWLIVSVIAATVAAFFAYRAYGFLWALLVYSGTGGLVLASLATFRVARQIWRNRR